MIRPICDEPLSANQALPSPVTTTPCGLEPRSGSRYSVNFPSGVIFAALFPSISVNHTVPSGPLAMFIGLASGLESLYSVICCADATEAQKTATAQARRIIVGAGVRR